MSFGINRLITWFSKLSNRGQSSRVLEVVELHTRGITVTTTPAAARVLRATEDLRSTVSRNWKK